MRKQQLKKDDIVSIADELKAVYGVTMDMNEVAEVLKCTKGSINNRICKGTFTIPIYKIGGKVLANTADVAECVEEAKLLRS